MASQKQGLIPLQNINLGGLAYSKWSGIKNSMYKIIGLDIHSQPGVVGVEQKLTKDTGSTVTEFCRARVSCSNGSQYWGSWTTGKIWECTSAGLWRLVHTVVPAAGSAAILWIEEYRGYLYIATQSRLHRITVALADDNNWAADLATNWATFGVTDSVYHPMLNHPKQQILYIGDGNQIAQVDGNTFSANALDITTPLRVSSLGEFGTDVLVGTYIADTVTKSQIFRWNGWSRSFTNSDSIPEVGINAFLHADNEVLVQAGKRGNIYSYDGSTLNLYGKIPGNYSSTAYGSVYPQSVGNFDGQMLFGFTNEVGAPVDQVVYRIARHNRNFPYVIDQPYPISERSSGEFVLSGIEIGGILVVGSNIFVAWKNGSSYGIDKLDVSNKLDGAYMETRVMSVNREEFANFSKATMAYATLPTDTSIDFYMDKNYEGYGAVLTKQVDTQRHIIETKNEATDFTTMQLKMKFTCVDNTAPQWESGGVFLQ